MSKEEPKKNHWYEMYELECLKTKELQEQIKEMKCCLSMWYEYENERNTPQINIDELLTETQQLIS